MKQQTNWKKRILVLSVVVVLLLASVTLGRAYISALHYQIDNMHEQLQSQLCREYNIQPASAFIESVEVERPSKYSFNEEDWVFQVVFTDDPTVHPYVFSASEGKFIPQ